MLQQAQNNSISARQTKNKSSEDELDIELFIDLVRQFPVIWNVKRGDLDLFLVHFMISYLTATT